MAEGKERDGDEGGGSERVKRGRGGCFRKEKDYKTQLKRERMKSDGQRVG